MRSKTSEKKWQVPVEHSSNLSGTGEGKEPQKIERWHSSFPVDPMNFNSFDKY